nr:HPr family phosphocarrier protein [uncultured Sellimonas sp.]
MVKKTIRFMSSGQMLSFCKCCQNMKSDIDLSDTTGRHFRIDGKSLLGVMSIKLGLPVIMEIQGEDEHLADDHFSRYEYTLY